VADEEVGMEALQRCLRVFGCWSGGWPGLGALVLNFACTSTAFRSRSLQCWSRAQGGCRRGCGTRLHTTESSSQMPWRTLVVGW